MRWWSVVVLAVGAFVYAHQASPPLRAPRADLANLEWLWVSALVAIPLLPLSGVINNRPQPRGEESAGPPQGPSCLFAPGVYKRKLRQTHERLDGARPLGL